MVHEVILRVRLGETATPAPGPRPVRVRFFECRRVGPEYGPRPLPLVPARPAPRGAAASTARRFHRGGGAALIAVGGVGGVGGGGGGEICVPTHSAEFCRWLTAAFRERPVQSQVQQPVGTSMGKLLTSTKSYIPGIECTGEWEYSVLNMGNGHPRNSKKKTSAPTQLTKHDKDATPRAPQSVHTYHANRQLDLTHTNPTRAHPHRTEPFRTDPPSTGTIRRNDPGPDLGITWRLTTANSCEARQAHLNPRVASRLPQRPPGARRPPPPLWNDLHSAVGSFTSGSAMTDVVVKSATSRLDRAFLARSCTRSPVRFWVQYPPPLRITHLWGGVSNFSSHSETPNIKIPTTRGTLRPGGKSFAWPLVPTLHCVPLRVAGSRVPFVQPAEIALEVGHRAQPLVHWQPDAAHAAQCTIHQDHRNIASGPDVAEEDSVVEGACAPSEMSCWVAAHRERNRDCSSFVNPDLGIGCHQDGRSYRTGGLGAERTERHPPGRPRRRKNRPPGRPAEGCEPPTRAVSEGGEPPMAAGGYFNCLLTSMGAQSSRGKEIQSLQESETGGARGP
eukprot:gene22289-biopygen8748